ncbi:flavin reductase family protein [Jiella mangrovi]|uniref:Flavin reductase family protein n=1 Tax=Jiella mangrovi TaxID=2821407 RepID=A0ABS4BCS1_9HYPH|nr:flavin reductase family protein [Jiella mangrovi]MBP0614561.1 flavin reductase family protein [Jiella mangrovi]
MSEKPVSAEPPAAGPARFRQGMRCLAGSVTVVAQQSAGGTLSGVTATAVCSLSAAPPSLIACINMTSVLAQGLVAGAPFSVNILSEHQEDIARAFGGQKGLSGRDRFIYGEWYRSDDGVPLLAAARATFECRVASFVDYGSHRAAIGLVRDVHMSDEADATLLFADGRFVTAIKTDPV